MDGTPQSQASEAKKRKVNRYCLTTLVNGVVSMRALELSDRVLSKELEQQVELYYEARTLLGTKPTWGQA
jgi:hypothetical protein